MSKQLSLGEGFQKSAKITRRSQFLTEMDRLVPCDKVCALVEPVYLVAGNGRPPRPLEMMVRVYFLPAVVQLVRCGDRGCVVRLRFDAPFRQAWF